ncbi:MAG: hypothetical protein R2745_19985 [Vicinamibacterales bacterium]
MQVVPAGRRAHQAASHASDPSGLVPDPHLTGRDTALLLLITLAGAAIRVAYQVDRSFVGDEIGTLIQIERSYRYLLTHFETWLTMNYFLVILKFFAGLFGPSPPVLTALPFAAGVATIPLTALLARQFLPMGASLAVAVLIAANPYLVHQSLNIRSYSLLVALSVLLALHMLRWLRQPGWRTGWTFGGTALLLVLMHPNGAYAAAALAAAAAMTSTAEFRYDSGPGTNHRRLVTLFVPTLVAGALSALFYSPIVAQMLATQVRFHEAAPAGAAYVTDVWAMYFGAGYLAWPIAISTLVGTWYAIEHRAAQRLILPVLALPPTLMATQGLAHYPWAFARFLVFTIPFVTIIAVSGLQALTPRRSRLGAGTLAGLLLMPTLVPGLVESFRQKHDYPWLDVRRHLADGHPGSLVIGLDFFAHHHLDPRPAVETYRRILLGSLEPAQVESAAAGDGAPWAFVVVHDVTITSRRQVHQYGRVSVVAYPLAEYRALMTEIRDDLVRTVEGSFPVGAEYEPLYSAILAANARLGQHTNDAQYLELRDASRSQSERIRHATSTMLNQDAERVAQAWRARPR